MAADAGFAERIPVFHEPQSKHTKELLFQIGVRKETNLEPFEEAVHASGQNTCGCCALEIRKNFQIHITLFQFQCKVSCGAALADVGRELCGDDGIALGRTGFHRRGVSPKPSLAGAVAVGTHDSLSGGIHLLFFHAAGWMQIVNAGQHILQSEGVIENAVGGIPKRQRQLRSREPSEERQEQSCQCTFTRAGLAHQKENELGFAPGALEKMIQRTEKGERQKRKENLLRRKGLMQK